MQEWLLYIVVLLMVSASAWFVVLLMLESRTPRLICLMYHRIAAPQVYERRRGTKEAVFTLPDASFEQQIAHLKQAGYAFVTPDQARLFAAGELDLPGPSVLMTFDDGCVSIDQVARPILERYGARATVFVTTDPQSEVFNLGGETDRRLTDDELRRIDGDTLCVESHAVTHRPLRSMSEDEIRFELAESKRELEGLLSREIKYLAIPGNWHDRRVMRIAREAGYKAVWVSNPGSVQVGSSAFGLPRVNVEGQLTLGQFIAAITPVGVAQRRVASWIKRAPGRLLGPRLWLPIRTVIMRRIPGRHLSNRRVILACSVLAIAAMLLLLAHLAL